MATEINASSLEGCNSTVIFVVNYDLKLPLCGSKLFILVCALMHVASGKFSFVSYSSRKSQMVLEKHSL